MISRFSWQLEHFARVSSCHEKNMKTFCLCLILSQKNMKTFFPGLILSRKTWKRYKDARKMLSYFFVTSWHTFEIFRSFSVTSWDTGEIFRSFSVTSWETRQGRNLLIFFRDKLKQGQNRFMLCMTSWDKGKISSCFAWQAETRAKSLHALRDKLRQWRNLSIFFRDKLRQGRAAGNFHNI